MKIAHHDLNKQVMIVAEIGNNHEGSYAMAEEMVGRAAEAGAHAVKFQTFNTEHYIRKADADRFSMLKRFQLTGREFEKLQGVAHRAGVLFLSTPFDLPSALMISRLVAAFKISSADNTFYPLMKRVAEFGKPVILSCGLAELPDIHYAKSLIEHTWYQKGVEQELAVLHCVSSYPVPPAYANLKTISVLRQTLGCTVGYSDHTLGIDAAVLGVAAGARIIEKHFTLDKNFSDFRDHHISANPEDLRCLVERIRCAEEMMGSGLKEPQECEKNLIFPLRRSIAAARDINSGEIICWDDITWLRPSGGMPPGNEYQVIGKKARKDIPFSEIILSDMLTT